MLTVENIDQLEAIIAATMPGQASRPSDGPEPWEWTVFTKPDGSPILDAEDVAETTAASARLSASNELHGITLAGPGDDAGPNVVCYTGNGPRSAAHARAIASLWMAAPDLLRIARQHLSS